jgi:predicted RNA-binding protein with PUA-like domain
VGRRAQLPGAQLHARRHAPGRQGFFYHSNCARTGHRGIAEVASDAYPDPSQFDPKSKYFDPGSSRDNPRWMLVDVKFVKKLKRTITLDELKGHLRWPRCLAAQGQPAVGDAGGSLRMAVTNHLRRSPPWSW